MSRERGTKMKITLELGIGEDEEDDISSNVAYQFFCLMSSL